MPDPLKPVNQSTQPLWLSSCSLSRRWTAPSCQVILEQLEQALGSVAVSARLCTRCGVARQRVERTESGCRGTREVSFIQELLERIGCRGNVHGLCCARRDELIVLYTEHHKRLQCALAPHFDWPKQFLHRISTAQPLDRSNNVVCTYVMRIRMLGCSTACSRVRFSPTFYPSTVSVNLAQHLPEQCTSAYKLMRRIAAATRLTVSILSAIRACTPITAQQPPKTFHC